MAIPRYVPARASAAWASLSPWLAAFETSLAVSGLFTGNEDETPCLNSCSTQRAMAGPEVTASK